MTVGLVLLDCFIAESRSLKDKRRILTSMFERLRRSFNVAACEVDHQDKWQRARVAVVFINTEQRAAQRTATKLVEFWERNPRINVLQSETELLR